MTRAWDAEEIAWAGECAAAGDTVEEIAAWADRSVEDVQSHIQLPRLTDGQRTALQMYLAGATLAAIGVAVKPDTARAKSLGYLYVRALRDRGFTLPARCPGRSPDQEARRYA